MRLDQMPRFGLLLGLLILSSTSAYALSVDDYVQSAERYVQSGELKKAVIEAKNALQKEPENGDVRLLLGRVYLRMGQDAAAEKELRHARKAGVARERVLIPLAQAYLGQGNAKAVLEQIQPEADDPAALRAEILTLRGRAYMASGDHAQAEAAFNEAEQLNWGKADLALARAQLALVDKNPEKALAQVEKALVEEPENSRALAMKGDLLRGDKPQEALQAYEQALKTNPYNRAALIGSATADIALARLDDAEQTLKRLDDFAPGLVQRQYLAAVIAFQRKQYDKVQELMAPVMRVLPDNLQGELLLGMTDYQQGRLEAANSHLSTFVKAVPGHLAARKLLATVKLKQGEGDKAVEILEPATEQGAKDSEFLSLLGAAYLKAGDTTHAMQYLELAADAAPDSADVQARLGLGHLAAGDTKQAVALLEDALRKNPELLGADIVLVQIHLRDGKYDEALKIAQDLAAKRKDDPLPLNLIAAAYLGKGDIPKAREALQQAVSVDPKFAPAHINLARLAIAEGKLDEARAEYQAVLSQDTDHVSAYLGLSQLETKAGDKDKSLEWLIKAHDEYPKALQPAVLLARRYVASGEALKAMPLAMALIDAHPQNSLALDTVTNVYVANGKLGEAIATYKKVAELNPGLAPVHARLGQLYLQHKEFEEARAAFTKALELQADNLQALTGLGAVDVSVGDSAAAEEVIGRIRKAHPDSPVGPQLQGDIQRIAKDYAAAAKSYAEAYQLKPSAQLSLLTYQMRKQAGDASGALAALEKGAADHPDAVEVHLVLANDYMEAQQSALAIREFERVKELQPDNLVAWNNLAWLYQEQGDAKALQYALKAKELAPKRPEVLDTYGWIELQLGDPAKGLSAIQEAAVYGPHLAGVQYHLAVAQDKNGQADAARKTLVRLLKSGKSFPERAEAQKLLSRLEAGAD